MQDALLIIDLQAGFFEAGSLESQRDELVKAANTLADAARGAELSVFLITTEHSRDRSTWTLNMLDDGQGYLFHGDPTAEVVEGLHTEEMTRVEKTRDSAWFATDLELRLKNFGVERVVICGVSTRGCIAETVRDAYARNIRAVVVTDAIADDQEDYHQVVLDQLVGDRQVELHTVAEVVAAWGEGSGA